MRPPSRAKYAEVSRTDAPFAYCCSLDRNRIVPDVFVHSRAAGAAPDVMVRLRVREAVSLAESTTAREDKLADVVAVGRPIVVPKKRESLATPCQLCPEPRAMIPRRPFGPVRAVGIGGWSRV